MKGEVYIYPLHTSLEDLKQNGDMPLRVCQELDYRLDACRLTGVVYILNICLCVCVSESGARNSS